MTGRDGFAVLVTTSTMIGGERIGKCKSSLSSSLGDYYFNRLQRTPSFLVSSLRQLVSPSLSVGDHGVRLARFPLSTQTPDRPFPFWQRPASGRYRQMICLPLSNLP